MIKYIRIPAKYIFLFDTLVGNGYLLFDNVGFFMFLNRLTRKGKLKGIVLTGKDRAMGIYIALLKDKKIKIKKVRENSKYAIYAVYY